MSITTQKLANISSMQTGKLNSNAAVPNGIFPFFTCAQETYRINKAAFNTEAVLLGGNNANGVFPLKYYNGEFNAYQRTYIIESLDRNVLDTRYLFYALQPALSKFQAVSIGTATQYLTKSILDNFKIGVPNLDVQKRIVNLLSSYDDLTENNRRRIALLEAAARLLYRGWFVHFRFPGHEHAKIVDGIPEGWEAYKLGDLLTKIKRPAKVKKEDYLEDASIPCVDQSQSFIGGYTEDEEAEITSPLPLVVFGDHTRALKFIDFPFACGADGTQLLYPKDDRLSIQYFYFAVGNIDLSNYFYARHFKFLKDQKLLVPTADLMAEFTDFAGDNLKQISALRETNHNLARARDLLLPRLMNGETAV